MPGKKKLRNEVHVTWHKEQKIWEITYPDPYPHLDSKGPGLATLVGRFKQPVVATATLKAMELKAELLVHNRDGKIGYRNSYGGDPKRRPG